MRRALRIERSAADRSRSRIDKVLAQVNERLSQGRSYLVGDSFTAADLTFAALAAPLIVPAEYGVKLPDLEQLSPPLVELVQSYQASAAGQFALRIYGQHRRRQPAS